MRISNEIDDISDSNTSFCGCLPDCNTIEYPFNVIDQSMPLSNSSEIHSVVTVLFGDSEFMAYRRYERFGGVTLLSNIGGLLGLFLGVSLLSIVEVLYFFTLRVCGNLLLAPRND
jgi:acid-sensing ion channel, other